MPISAAQKDKLGTKLMKQAVTTSGPLKAGMKLRAVAYLERALQIAGFDPGNKDTTFDAKTAKAVKLFQAAWGIPVTGELDEKTLAKLDHTVGRARKHGSGCPDCNKKGFQGTIGIGQKNLDVFNAERRLKKLGYDVGAADGTFDQQTAEAVRQFKADEGMKSKSSLISANVMKELGKDAGSLEHRAYRRRVTKDLKQHRRLDALTKKEAGKANTNGSTGIGPGSSKRALQNVQAHLRAAGFDPGVADGKYDDRTRAMIERFQRKEGLNPTGIVGPKTWAKLEKSMFEAKNGTSPAQRVGERSAAVLRSEKMLKKLGYNVKVDGVFDRQTQKASRKVERRVRGIGKDGAIGAEQLDRMRQLLRAKQDPGRGPMLKKGFRGQPVRILQRRLEAMGFDVGKVDGDFGKKTRAAVKRFQRTFKLEADGVVGKRTWRMLGVRSKGKVNKPGAAGGGNISAGGSWGGSYGVSQAATNIARSMGIPVTSTKRNLAQTIAVGSSTGSDHYTGNTTAYAVDYGVSGSRGDALARAIAQKYGIPTSNIGTFNYTYKVIDGKTYRLQLLWRVSGHFDHVHFGIRRV